MDASHPVLRRALAAAHAHLGRLARYRDVGKDADPYATHTLQMARDGAAGGLDLARRDAAGLGGLQPKGAEIECEAALGGAVDAPLVGLSEFRSSRLKHVVGPMIAMASALSARHLLLLGALVLGHRVVR